LCCILKSTDKNIGFAGLKYLEEFGEVDVAFRLMRVYWGFGLATEAALASVRFGFADLGLKQIIGPVTAENAAFRTRAGKNRAALRRNGGVLGKTVLKIRYHSVVRGGIRC
jgi:ribosomal-protein-alanine N-acetyltransferase